MCSPDVTARVRVLAELAALGPSPADASRPGGVGVVGLLGQVRDLAAFADQVTGELARLAAALDAADGAAEAGYSSVAGFLRHGCGRSPGRAGELVAAGRALRRLAATGKALMAGQISFDAAHVICRAAGQIEDEAAALAAEDLLLAAARNRRPDLAHRAGQHPGPDGEAPPGRGSASRRAGIPGPGPRHRAGRHPRTRTRHRAGRHLRGSRRRRVRWVPWAGGGFPGWIGARCAAWGQELLYRADPDAVEERERKRFERRTLSFGFTLDDTGTISGVCRITRPGVSPQAHGLALRARFGTGGGSRLCAGGRADRKGTAEKDTGPAPRTA